MKHYFFHLISVILLIVLFLIALDLVRDRQKDAKMLDEAKIGPELIESLGKGMQKLAETTNTISEATSVVAANNEFGHPEWIDFPRAENGWSYDHARRQWSLRDDPALRVKGLGDFDAEMIRVVSAHHALRGTSPVLLAANDADQTLAFWRGGLRRRPSL